MWHSYKHSTYQKQQQYLSYSLGSCASVLLWLACHPTNTCLEEPWESKLWWHLGQLSYRLISELVPRQSKLRKLQVLQSTWCLTVMHFSLLQAQRQKLKWSDQGMNCPGQVCGCTCYSTAQSVWWGTSPHSIPTGSPDGDSQDCCCRYISAVPTSCFKA